MSAKKSTRDFVELNIGDICSADENLRDAVPHLSIKGYGIFHGTDEHQDSLVSLALSEDSLKQTTYVKLIEEQEPDIESLAANMATMGLLEPIRVRLSGEKGKYDLVFGCRRCLAWLFNYARSAGKIPARITAEIVETEGKDALLTSLSENIRVEPSPIDEARSFKKLEKAFAMKASEIASAMGKDVKIVRERLKLLKLPLEIQEKVHLGKLAQKKALAYLDDDRTAVASSDHRKLPPIKEIERLYNAARDQLPDGYNLLITEEVRRLFALWLKVSYTPRTESQKPPVMDMPASVQSA
jgi:ParB/RepB/Spo0J family partition protein